MPAAKTSHHLFLGKAFRNKVEQRRTKGKDHKNKKKIQNEDQKYTFSRMEWNKSQQKRMKYNEMK